MRERVGETDREGSDFVINQTNKTINQTGQEWMQTWKEINKGDAIRKDRVPHH